MAITQIQEFLNRPQRTAIIDEIGNSRSLSTGKSAYEQLQSGEDILLLGLGVDLAYLKSLIKNDKNSKENPKIYYLDSPDFTAQMTISYHEDIPNDWIRISHDKDTELLNLLLKNASVYRYIQNLVLFNSFWSNIIANFKFNSITHNEKKSKTVIIPSTQNSILNYEVLQTFKELGYAPKTINAENCLSELMQVLKNEKPALFFSVNMQGFDREAIIFELLKKAEIPSACWCVDNIWNILSNYKQKWWQGLNIFVTDNSFVEQLKKHGAKSVHHLPLGTWFKEPSLGSDLKLNKICFVGRSKFPEKDKFFAANKLNKGLFELSQKNKFTSIKSRADANWWLDKLNIQNLWNNTEIRAAFLGAETCSLQNRIDYLIEAQKLGLTIYGDADWSNLLGENIDLRSPVDYYNGLSQIYKQAEYSLNMTSFLLASGLTQRHFDVFACGGFLLTDYSEGLNIFPTDLVQEICVYKPKDLMQTIVRFEKDCLLKYDVRNAWQKILYDEHSLKNRLEFVCSVIL